MRKIQRYTRFEMFSHVEACRSSKQSQADYCKKKGIALSTFQYWAKKYREEFTKDEASEETSGFIPIPLTDKKRYHPFASARNTLNFIFGYQ